MGMDMGAHGCPTGFTYLTPTQVRSEEIHWCTGHAGLLLCHMQYHLKCFVQPTRAHHNPAQSTVEIYHAQSTHYVCCCGLTDGSISVAQFDLLIEQANKQGNSLSVPWEHAI